MTRTKLHAIVHDAHDGRVVVVDVHPTMDTDGNLVTFSGRPQIYFRGRPADESAFVALVKARKAEEDAKRKTREAEWSKTVHNRNLEDARKFFAMLETKP